MRIVKGGEVPADWNDMKKRQKDADARWTKKHGKSFYGYKNHVSVDRDQKVIRRWSMTPASVHDSRVFDELLDGSNTSGDVWADSAYWSDKHEKSLATSGYRSHIHRKGMRGKPLTDRNKEANRKRSQIRARVEHVFGMQSSFGVGKYIRTIGYARARIKIGMMNLAYNLKRLVWLVGNVPPPRKPVTA